MNEKKYTKIGIVALVFAILALSQASAISTYLENVTCRNCTIDNPTFVNYSGTFVSDDPAKLNINGSNSMTGDLYMSQNRIINPDGIYSGFSPIIQWEPSSYYTYFPQIVENDITPTDYACFENTGAWSGKLIMNTYPCTPSGYGINGTNGVNGTNGINGINGTNWTETNTKVNKSGDTMTGTLVAPIFITTSGIFSSTNAGGFSLYDGSTAQTLQIYTGNTRRYRFDPVNGATFDLLAGSGNAMACLDSTGKLYRGTSTSC